MELEWNWTDLYTIPFTKWAPRPRWRPAITYLTGKAARIAHPAKGDSFLAMANADELRDDI